MTQHTDEVPSALADALASVDLNTPVDQVIQRGRRLRVRRRVLAGGLAVTAAAALLAGPLTHLAEGTSPQPAVATAAPRTHASTGVRVNLAAYTVQTNADGTVTVTVRQMFDPADLRTTLAQAGVPAVVSVAQAHAPETCTQATQVPGLRSGVVVATNPGATGYPGVTIRPAAIPAGAKIYFAVAMDGTHPDYVAITVFTGPPPTCLAH
jgi:hypothetical protein